MENKAEKLAEKSIELGGLVLRFGETYRSTYYPDGKTSESDTDHTTMLGLLAPALAERVAPELDRGKVAELALVHDFVEVYAGDVATIGIDDDILRRKKEKEAQALERLKSEYDEVFPWIGRYIEAYEEQSSPEARFVKCVDKLLPAITHILNRGVTFQVLTISQEALKAHRDKQRGSIQKMAADWPGIIALYDELIKREYASMGPVE